jgi:hypothetical protein
MQQFNTFWNPSWSFEDRLFGLHFVLWHLSKEELVEIPHLHKFQVI